jgi:acyl-coenzyme A thioesterase PaaI-like protein
MSVKHHDLCFGCGDANLFGLHLEAESSEGDGLAGRFHLRDEHVGRSGFAHSGVISAVLFEAMALALHAEGTHAAAEHLEVDIESPVPVDSTVELRARVERRETDRLWLRATAVGPQGPCGEAQGKFIVRSSAEAGTA